MVGRRPPSRVSSEGGTVWLKKALHLAFRAREGWCGWKEPSVSRFERGRGGVVGKSPPPLENRDAGRGILCLAFRVREGWCGVDCRSRGLRKAMITKTTHREWFSCPMCSWSNTYVKYNIHIIQKKDTPFWRTGTTARPPPCVSVSLVDVLLQLWVETADTSL